ncbi:cyclin-dependent kinase inhibitor 1B-like [Pelodytes ibericus]
MSGVRLSPGSPGVERVSPRAPGSPRAPARRCLFGPVDHGLLSRELERHRREEGTKQRLRWNYDFANDRPLDGLLKWELAGPDTPEFYRRGPHPKAGAEEEPGSRAMKRNGETTDSSSPNVKKSHRTGAGEKEEANTAPSPEQTPKKARPST